MTDTFLELSDNPDSFTIDYIHMQRLERFHVIMYSKSCSAATVNDGEPGEAATVLTWPTLP